MIEPNDMVAFWSVDGEMKITELVIDCRSAPQLSTDHHRHCDGAVSADWLAGCDHRTPMGLYAYLATTYGFASRDIHAKVLRQFQKVSGQLWADLWELANKEERA